MLRCTLEQAIKKTILFLHSYLRLLKVYSFKEPKISAFVFPQNEIQQCVGQVTMEYIARSVKFVYSINCLDKDEVGPELANALLANRMVFDN